MVDMEIVVATHNQHKLAEIAEILGTEVRLLSQDQLGFAESPDENGSTFLENACIKAQALSAHLADWVLADDSGLCVHALNDEPGIYSARYLGEASYAIKNQSLIDRLAGHDDRSAAFVCALVLMKGDRVHHFIGTCEGQIGFEIQGEHGFGYDPIFIPAGYENSFGVLPADVKNQISHRGRALQALKDFIQCEKL